MAPKKISRKILKEDKFVTSVLKIVQVFKVHWKLVVIVAVGLIILVSAYFGYGYYLTEMEQKALLPLSEAFGYYYQEISLPKEKTQEPPPLEELSPAEIEKYQKALNAFSKVARSYPRTRSGKLALLYKGHCYYRLGKLPEAIKVYEEFIRKYEKDFLAIYAWQGLGYCHEIQGNYEQAIEVFRNGIKSFPRDFLASKLYLDLGRNYETTKDYDHAKETYNSLLERFPNSLWVEEARYRIKWIDAHR